MPSDQFSVGRGQLLLQRAQGQMSCVTARDVTDEVLERTAAAQLLEIAHQGEPTSGVTPPTEPEPIW